MATFSTSDDNQMILTKNRRKAPRFSYGDIRRYV